MVKIHYEDTFKKFVYPLGASLRTSIWEPLWAKLRCSLIATIPTKNMFL